jgi:D-glycero-D-manno-heptose 1,7-bisphosphate phosphatase
LRHPDFPHVGEDGVWAEPISDLAPFAGKPALFLDRDGCIVDEVIYLHKVEDIVMIDGAAETIRLANSRNIPVIMVTNQAGIGRGLYEWGDFFAVQEVILGNLTNMNAIVDVVMACPFHTEGRPGYDQPDHPARKPNPGMLLAGAALTSADLSQSWIAGDRAGDVGAGRNAGCAGGIQLRTGHGTHVEERDESLSLAHDTYDVHVAGSIAELPSIIPFLK